jgi:hypothetical protein
MIVAVSQHAASTTGWDVAAALGTIAAAVATAAAVVVALVVGAKDRRAADGAVQAQMAAARRRAAQEHEIELLLAINDQVARYRAHPGAPQQAEAQAVLRGLKHALPEAPEYEPLVQALDSRRFNTSEAQTIAAGLIREVAQR